MERVSYEHDGIKVEAEREEGSYGISFNHGAKTGVSINIPVLGNLGINTDWGKGISLDARAGISINGYGVGLDLSTHIGGKGMVGLSGGFGETGKERIIKQAYL